MSAPTLIGTCPGCGHPFMATDPLPEPQRAAYPCARCGTGIARETLLGGKPVHLSDDDEHLDGTKRGL